MRGVNLKFIDSLNNNGTKYLLIFDNSFEEICNSKVFVDIATAGRHRGLSTIYIKHNLFHQSNLGTDVELQNTHIVLFKSPRDVMQVTTLSTQFGLGSELVDWYRDATYVPFGHLLIDLSPRTDDRLRYCTKTGSIPSKFYITDRLKQPKLFDDEHTKSLYSPTTETKAAFAERTTRSLKNIPYPYIEGSGYKYVHRLTQFVTTLMSRRNFSIDLIPKKVKKSHFLSILSNKPVQEIRIPKFKNRDRVRFSKYDLPLSKGYEPQLT